MFCCGVVVVLSIHIDTVFLGIDQNEENHMHDLSSGCPPHAPLFLNTNFAFASLIPPA
jgi:hypothetical protein